MRLIDADKLYEDIGMCEGLKDGETCSEWLERMKTTIDNQPTIYPIFSGRQSGKTVLKYYLEICKVLENHGISANRPVENLNYVLDQYQKVILELTGSMLSKLTYDADFVIPYIVDRLDEFESESNKEFEPKKPREKGKLSWQDHEHHKDMLKEFYYYNKYIMTEQMKDSLLDAIECMNYIQNNINSEISDEEEK